MNIAEIMIENFHQNKLKMAILVHTFLYNYYFWRYFSLLIQEDYIKPKTYDSHHVTMVTTSF